MSRCKGAETRTDRALLIIIIAVHADLYHQSISFRYRYFNRPQFSSEEVRKGWQVSSSPLSSGI